MRLDHAGIPFISGALLGAGVLALAVGPRWAVPPVGLALLFAFFFRDPERLAPSTTTAVVLSPADGRVLIAGEAQREAAPPGEWRQVSIFLSPLDVHVNRVPVSGRVTKIEYHAGRFLPAYRRNAGAVNERSEIWIEHDARTIVFRQIVGILARRVVCRLQIGQTVEAGERCGIMKFGSRMDVFLPTSAVIRVAVGDMVRGGETVLAAL